MHQDGGSTFERAETRLPIDGRRHRPRLQVRQRLDHGNVPEIAVRNEYQLEQWFSTYFS